MNKRHFWKMVDDFENQAIKTINDSKEKKVIIKGKKFLGKSVTSEKLFSSLSDDVIMYHSGCNPEADQYIYSDFIHSVSEWSSREKSVSIVLDEFYNLEILTYLSKLTNIKCYIFTNDASLRCSDFADFNYFYYYEKYIWNTMKSYFNYERVLNLREICFLLENNEKQYRFAKSPLNDFRAGVEEIRTQPNQSMLIIKKDSLCIENKYIWERSVSTLTN